MQAVRKPTETHTMNTQQALTVIAITTAVYGKEAQLRASQEQLVADTLKEPGCLRYELHQSQEDGRILIFVETWETEELWQQHMNGEAIRLWKANGGEELIQEIIIHKMDLVAG